MSKEELVSKEEWTYTRALREGDKFGGLVLQNVRHQQYLLAEDIRVTRLRVGSRIADKPILKDYYLGSPELPFKTATGTISLPAEQGLIFPFNPPFRESASFETQGPALGPNTGSQKLTVQQNYLFTRYGKDPPHEPGGIINAVRIYPLLSFSYPVSDSKARQVDYIRADYRLALTVEQFIYGTTAVKKETGFRDQIGVFRDAEEEAHTLKNIFDAAEKPVRWELLGEGLNWGQKSQWDNIHQWAAGKLPETPGAAHAAHIHWRWGKPATIQARFKSKAGPQFAGLGGVAGSPQIDPRIPQQRLRFAITAFTPTPGGGPKAWAADENGSTADFEELFIRARGSTPLDISAGTGLVLWFSLEARRQPSTAPWQGTFFAHGMFFAHDLTPFFFGLAANAPFVNLSDPLQKSSTDAQVWWRPERPSMP